MQGYPPERRRAAYGWNNAVARLAHGIAGGFHRYRDLPRSDRLSVREAAKRLHARGMKFAQAGRDVDAAKEGFVYVISNPAWPGYVKIGRAAVVEDRLATFQTGCPHRAYQVEGAQYTADAVAAEAELHQALSLHREGGEWFRLPVSAALGALHDYVSNPSAPATIPR